MKLTYFQAELQFKKITASIYVVSGDELLLKNDLLQLLRKSAKKSGFETRIRLSGEQSTDSALYSHLNGKSMFEETRVLELDFRDHLPSKIAATTLTDYIAEPDPQTLLLIEMNKIDQKIAKQDWYKSLEKNGVVVAVWPITRDKLPQWLITRALKYKMYLQKDAANLLADYVEGNLIAAAQMIEQIYLLKPEAAIDIKLIEQVLTDESQFTIFDLTDHLLAGNVTRSLIILARLRENGVEPILILWSILRELRLMAEFSQQIKAGIKLTDLFAKHKIFIRKQMPIRAFLQHGEVADCWEFIRAASEIDKAIKGVLPVSPWSLLEIFCLRFQQKTPCQSRRII